MKGAQKKQSEREKRRVAWEIKKKKALEVQKKEPSGGRNLLLNYLCNNKNSSTEIHKNMKFLPFTRKKSFVYAKSRRQTLSSTGDLFEQRSFDFVAKQLLNYRTNSSGKLTSRSCLRRRLKWSYRHFFADHRPPWSGIETRTSVHVLGRRPFAEDKSELLNYNSSDSGIEWYGDIWTGLHKDEWEGESLGEGMELDSEEESQECLRADGYEDDDFLTEDEYVYFPKIRRKEDRYPLRPSRRRADVEIKPIELQLPPMRCRAGKTSSEFYEFLNSRAGLVLRPNADIISKQKRLKTSKMRIVNNQKIYKESVRILKPRRISWEEKLKRKRNRHVATQSLQLEPLPKRRKATSKK